MDVPDKEETNFQWLENFEGGREKKYPKDVVWSNPIIQSKKKKVSFKFYLTVWGNSVFLINQ